jgi:hypothetical protein
MVVDVTNTRHGGPASSRGGCVLPSLVSVEEASESPVCEVPSLDASEPSMTP